MSYFGQCLKQNKVGDIGLCPGVINVQKMVNAIVTSQGCHKWERQGCQAEHQRVLHPERGNEGEIKY